MNGHTLLYTLLFVMVMFWSGNYIVGKVALREFPPLLLTGLRVSLAGVLVAPAYLWEGRRVSDRWGRKDIPLLLQLGIFGVALNQLFFVFGLSLTSVAHSAIIVGMNPIVILLLASLVGLERLNPRRIAGMLLALAGVAVLKIFQAEPKGASAPTWAGDLLVFLSGFMFALFTIFGKRATGKHTSITVNTFAYVGGAVALAPLTLWQAAAFPFARVSATGWLSLTYMALCPSVIAYLIYYHALTRIPASRVAAFCYFQPLMATMLGVLMLGEHLSVPLVAGGTIIFCGVYLAERG